MELDHGTTERRRIIVSGVVQGVGFRPFVHRLASEHGFGGFALNDGRGVVVEVEGDSDALHDFTEALREQAPEGVAAVAARACAELHEPRARVALSGGTFQNLRLLGSVRRELASLGLGVLTHRSVPPNDGGISFGQAAIAARRVD